MCTCGDAHRNLDVCSSVLYMQRGAGNITGSFGINKTFKKSFLSLNNNIFNFFHKMKCRKEIFIAN